MTHHEERNKNIKLLGEQIKGIKIAMLTTVEEDGILRSRPMATQQFEFDGSLWFFTEDDASKVNDIRHHDQVNLSYASPDDNRYVSITGKAEIIRDQQKMKSLWQPYYQAWFPKGMADPHLALLRVDAANAEYWDASSSKMVRVANIAKALATGQGDKGIDNKKLNLQ